MRHGGVWALLRGAHRTFVPDSLRALDAERRELARAAVQTRRQAGRLAQAVQVNGALIETSAADRIARRVWVAESDCGPSRGAGDMRAVDIPLWHAGAGRRIWVSGWIRRVGTYSHDVEQTVPVRCLTQQAPAAAAGFAWRDVIDRAGRLAEQARAAKRRFRLHLVLRDKAWADVEVGLRRGTGHGRSTV